LVAATKAPGPAARPIESKRIAAGRGRSPVDGFPFQIEETGEAPQRLADIHRNVLSFTRPVSPQRRDGHRLGGQADRSHGAEPEWAGNNRIRSVEGEFAAAVRSRHSDVFQDVIDCAVKVEIRVSLRIAELRYNCLGEQIRSELFFRLNGRCDIHLSKLQNSSGAQEFAF